MADEDLDVGAEGAEGAEGEAAEGEKKKSPMMLIIILVVGVLVMGAAGYFFVWPMIFGEPEETAAEQKEGAEGEEGEEGEAKKEEDSKPGSVLSLAPFIVNLADAEGKRYLKLSLAVDAKDEELKKKIEDRMPRIRDSILLLLTSKSYADISTMAGKIRLRNEVLKLINRALAGKGSVHAVYFTEFVVQ